MHPIRRPSQATAEPSMPIGGALKLKGGPLPTKDK